MEADLVCRTGDPAGRERAACGFSGAADFTVAPRPSSEGGPLRILLVHSPDQLPWARANQMDLMLVAIITAGTSNKSSWGRGASRSEPVRGVLRLRHVPSRANGHARQSRYFRASAVSMELPAGDGQADAPRGGAERGSVRHDSGQRAGKSKVRRKETGPGLIFVLWRLKDWHILDKKMGGQEYEEEVEVKEDWSRPTPFPSSFLSFHFLVQAVGPRYGPQPA